MAFEYAVVLTGSIATGKSSVVDILLSEGFYVIDADKIAHQILEKQSSAIVNLFGDEVLVNDKVDRKLLGSIVFSNKEKRKELEDLLHPLIYDEIEKQATKQDLYKKPYIVDIPLFFEGGRYPIERSIVVYTTKEQQLKRLMQRDGYNNEDALKRISTQIDVAKKRKQATYVIDNTGNRKQLQQECERVKEEILGDVK